MASRGLLDLLLLRAPGSTVRRACAWSPLRHRHPAPATAGLLEVTAPVAAPGGRARRRHRPGSGQFPVPPRALRRRRSTRRSCLASAKTCTHGSPRVSAHRPRRYEPHSLGGGGSQQRRWPRRSKRPTGGGVFARGGRAPRRACLVDSPDASNGSSTSEFCTWAAELASQAASRRSSSHGEQSTSQASDRCGRLHASPHGTCTSAESRRRPRRQARGRAGPRSPSPESAALAALGHGL
jgi:hypothetical protein